MGPVDDEGKAIVRQYLLDPSSPEMGWHCGVCVRCGPHDLVATEFHPQRENRSDIGWTNARHEPFRRKRGTDAPQLVEWCSPCWAGYLEGAMQNWDGYRWVHFALGESRYMVVQGEKGKAGKGNAVGKGEKGGKKEKIKGRGKGRREKEERERLRRRAWKPMQEGGMRLGRDIRRGKEVKVKGRVKGRRERERREKLKKISASTGGKVSCREKGARRETRQSLRMARRETFWRPAPEQATVATPPPR